MEALKKVPKHESFDVRVFLPKMSNQVKDFENLKKSTITEKMIKL